MQKLLLAFDVIAVASHFYSDVCITEQSFSGKK